MNLNALTPELLDKSAALQDLDAALHPLMRAVDPANQFDLGGWAADYFSGHVEYVAPMDNLPAIGRPRDVWNHVDPIERRRLLLDFFQSTARGLADE